MTQHSTTDAALKTMENVGNKTVQKVTDTVSSAQESLTKGASDLAETVTTTLKSAGVDTDAVMETAKEKVSALQTLLTEEVNTRPLRALGVAAVVGMVIGFLGSR